MSIGDLDPVSAAAEQPRKPRGDAQCGVRKPGTQAASAGPRAALVPGSDVPNSEAGFGQTAIFPWRPQVL